MCMEIAQIKQDLENFQCPKWQQLPDFDVYMDQVIFFINDRLSPLFFLEDKSDKVITSNMVNNYVKNSIVHPPIKKHYKQYHLAYLIAVCILKKCYSLTEIQTMIEIVRRLEPDDTTSSIATIYNSFSDCFDHYLHQVLQFGMIKQEFQPEHMNDETQLMISVIKTVVYKMFTELEILTFENAEA